MQLLIQDVCVGSEMLHFYGFPGDAFASSLESVFEVARLSGLDHAVQ